MAWNEEHINEVTYPDHPDLEQALGHFREQYSWYKQQLKHRKKVIDTSPVQAAWNTFLTLRNLYYPNF